MRDLPSDHAPAAAEVAQTSQRSTLLQQGMRNRPAAARRPPLPPIEHVSITAATPGLPARAYRSGLKRCAQTGEWRAALQLLERLSALYASAPPHAPSYANAMLACRRGGMWPQALRLLTELQEGGGQPNPIPKSNHSPKPKPTPKPKPKPKPKPNSNPNLTLPGACHRLTRHSRARHSRAAS